MSRLLCLTVVLFSITCCSLITSGSAESIKDDSIHQINEIEHTPLQTRIARDTGIKNNYFGGKGKEINKGQGKKTTNRRNRGKKYDNVKEKTNTEGKSSQKLSKKTVENRKNGRTRKKTNTKPKQIKDRRARRKNNRKLKEKRRKTKNGRNQKKNIAKRRKKTEKRKVHKNKNKAGHGKGRRSKNNEKQANDCTDACAEKISDISEWSRGKYSNLGKQLNRTEAFVDLTDKKYVKRDVFNSPKELLLRTLGGDSSKPMCGTQPAHPDDIAILRTLEQCEANLTVTCQPLMTQADENLWKNCHDIRSTMSDLLLKLEDKTSCKDVCQAANDINDKDVQGCINDIKSTKDKIDYHWKKECNIAFLECRKAERAVADIVDRCKFCPPSIVMNITIAQIHLTILLQINAAIINMQNTFGATLTTIGITVIPACTIQPGKTVLKSREKRQSFEGEDARCLALLDEWKSFNTSADAAANSGDDPLDVDASEQALSALQSISKRSDVEGDLKSCQQEQNQRQLSCSLAINYISVYYFWAIYWNTVVVQVKITIISILYPILHPTNQSIITCITSIVTEYNATTHCMQVTTASTNLGRRWRLMQQMKKLNF